MGEFRREMLPGWPYYAHRQGMTLEGRGTWRTTRCDLHGGPNSLRVDVESGGCCCMARGAHGIALRGLNDGRWHAGRWNSFRELADAEVAGWLARVTGASR